MTYSFPMPICEDIWDLKYRLKNSETGEPVDITVEDTWRRVAKSLASVEENQEPWEDNFYHAMTNWKFMPAGRILAGAGTDRNVTLLNCYVMGTIPDSLDGIFDALKEAALTMQQGGGIGYDFSTLRPKGALVKRVGADASGPLPFMDTWDAMCRTIMSAGTRRGAMMATMRCDHPDIEAFIEAKSDPTRLRMFNVSVLCTDAFMEAVKRNQSWNLVFEGKVYQTVSALKLWRKIMRSTYDYAEPGVLFIDRINQKNNLRYFETIAATNPCVGPETLILTDRGYVPIGDVIGQTVRVWNGIEFTETSPRKTGENQKMVTVTLSDGSTLRCTEAHRFVLSDGSRVPARDLLKGDKLQKATWPVIQEGNDEDLDYYAQGFYSGDGTPQSQGRGGHYIYLHGRKREIPHDWKALSRRTYPVTGGYSGTDLSLEKDYLFFSAGTFRDKNFVPLGATLKSRKLWLAGLADSDGCVTKDSCIQISSKNQEFLRQVKLMLNTMGATGTLSPMKNCWRLSISGNDAHRLSLPTYRLKLSKVSFPKARFPKVLSVVPSGIEPEVFCFTETGRNMGVFDGVLTAQCGEQPLPPYGACLLGSINLPKFILDPFTSQARLNKGKLCQVVKTAIRMMDNVNDVSLFPLKAQRVEAQRKRRIGLGVTGLADMLVMLRCVYGSPEAVSMTRQILQDIAHIAYETSVDLAIEKSPFPAFDATEYLADGTFASTLNPKLQERIRTHGIRNSHLLSIAPTGTISLYGGNVSSGIEPIFAKEYIRKVTRKDGTRTEEEVMDYAVRVWHDLNAGKPLPDYFVTAQDLSPRAHVEMQCAAQQWIDSSISKTINLPEDISFADFEQVYMDVYKNGGKGCTTYRPNAVTGSVISVKEDKPKTEVHSLPLLDRPEAVVGKTYKLKFSGDDHALYLTINDVEVNGKLQPFEVFLNSKNMQHYAWTVALTRMISAIFRRGGDVSFVAEELRSVFDPKGGGWVKGRYQPSLLALIGHTLEEHMRATGYMTSTETVSEALVPEAKVEIEKPNLCPKCSSSNYKHEGGCTSCGNCGYSSCG